MNTSHLANLSGKFMREALYNCNESQLKKVEKFSVFFKRSISPSRNRQELFILASTV